LNWTIFCLFGRLTCSISLTSDMTHQRYFAMLTYLLVVCISLENNTANAQAAKKIAYPQPLADSMAIIFLPGLVSKDSLDFNAAFSPDGKAFYFSRSKNRQSKIYVSYHNGENWTEPVHAAFTGGTQYAEADPAFGPDGRLYFISNRPRNQSDTSPDYDIWSVKPLPGGHWSEPENMTSLNSDSSEFYISFARNGNLYFASSRAGGFGEEDIYVSRLVNARYSTPENLGPAVNTAKSEYDPGISPQEDIIVFASSNRGQGFGGADLYCSVVDVPKKWLPATHLGKTFNTKTREFCPYFSPDEKYFFFSSEGDIKWISLKILQKQTHTIHYGQ
jgi:hypothetical protein